MGSRPIKEYKIGVFGDKNCGKTCLINKFIQHRKTGRRYSIGAPEIIDNFHYAFNGEQYNLKIWDMPGLGSYPLSSQYVDGLDGCLLCFDVTCKRSLSVIQQFVDELNKKHPEYIKNISFLLIGSKSDSSQKNVINSKDVYRYSIKANIIYLEESATQQDVKEIMNLLLTLIDNKKRL